MLNIFKKFTAVALVLSIVTQSCVMAYGPDGPKKQSPSSFGDLSEPLLLNSSSGSPVSSPQITDVSFGTDTSTSTYTSSPDISPHRSPHHSIDLVSLQKDELLQKESPEGYIAFCMPKDAYSSVPEELRDVLEYVSQVRLGEKAKFSRVQKAAAVAMILSLAYAVRGEGLLARVQATAWVSDEQYENMSTEDQRTWNIIANAADYNAITWLSPYACLLLGKLGTELAKDPIFSFKRLGGWAKYYASSLARACGKQDGDPEAFKPKSIFKENRLWLRRLIRTALVGGAMAQAAIPTSVLYGEMTGDSDWNDANHKSMVPFLFLFESIRSYDSLSPLHGLVFNRFSQGETKEIVRMRQELLRRFEGAKERVFRLNEKNTNSVYTKFLTSSQETLASTEEKLLADTLQKISFLSSMGADFTSLPTAKRTWAARILGGATAAGGAATSALLTYYGISSGCGTLGINDPVAQEALGITGSIPGAPIAVAGAVRSNMRYFSTLFDLCTRNPVTPHPYSSNPWALRGIFALSSLEGMVFAVPNVVAASIKMMTMEQSGMTAMGFGGMIGLLIPYWVSQGMLNTMTFFDRYANIPHSISDIVDSAKKGIETCRSGTHTPTEFSYLRKRDFLVQATMNVQDMVARLSDEKVVALYKEVIGGKNLQPLYTDFPEMDIKETAIDPLPMAPAQAEPGRARRLLSKLCFWKSNAQHSQDVEMKTLNDDETF